MTRLPTVNYQLPNQAAPDRLIALVGEAPGRDEVKEQKPFVGRSGRLLDGHLQAAGIERPRCLVANVFRYQPPDNKVAHFFASRTKARRLGLELAEHLGPFGTSDYCLNAYADEIATLRQTLAEWRPAVIVALGRTPLWALTGLAGILERRGTFVPCRLLADVPVMPTYHPSYLLRGNRDAEPHFQADLRRAAALITERPN